MNREFDTIFNKEVENIRLKFLETQPVYNHYLVNDPQFRLLIESFCFLSAGIKDQSAYENLTMETKINSVLYKTYNPYVSPKSFCVQITPTLEKTKKPYTLGQKIFFEENNNTYEFSCNNLTVLPIKIENLDFYGQKLHIDFVCSDVINQWGVFELDLFFDHPKSIFLIHGLLKKTCFLISGSRVIKVKKTLSVFKNNIYEPSNPFNGFMNYNEDIFLFKRIIITIDPKELEQNTKEFKIVFDLEDFVQSISIKKENILLNTVIVRSWTNQLVAYLNNNYENLSHVLVTPSDYKIFSIKDVFFFEDKKKVVIPQFFDRRGSEYFWYWEFENRVPILRICSDNDYSKIFNKQIFCSSLQTYVLDEDFFFTKPKIFFEKPLVFESINLIYQSRSIEKKILTGDFIRYNLCSMNLNVSNLNWFINLWAEMSKTYNVKTIFNHVKNHQIERSIKYTYKNLYPTQTTGFMVNIVTNQRCTTGNLEEAYGFLIFLHYYIDHDSFIVLTMEFNEKKLTLEWGDNYITEKFLLQQSS